MESQKRLSSGSIPFSANTVHNGSMHYAIYGTPQNTRFMRRKSVDSPKFEYSVLSFTRIRIVEEDMGSRIQSPFDLQTSHKLNQLFHSVSRHAILPKYGAVRLQYWFLHRVVIQLFLNCKA